MRGMLRFVLILPDGSKSLIPAEWTDAGSGDRKPVSTGDLIGSLQHLLQLRSLTDALLQRSTAFVRAQSGPEQESHAATESELHRHPCPAGVPVGEPEQRTEKLIIETLARMMTKATAPANQPQEPAND